MFNRPSGRMVSMWGNKADGHGYADMIHPEADPDTAGAYLPATDHYMLETHDAGTTWTVVTGDVWPLLDV